MNDGEAGMVALTNLNAYVRPLIRVTIGDMATMANAPCSCGRGFPLLARVLGRADEFLFLPDGKWLDPVVVESALATVLGLLGYRLVQDSETSARVEAVVTDDAVLPKVRERVLSLLGAIQDVAVERRDKIQVDRAGKVRRVIRQMKSEPVLRPHTPIMHK